MALSNWIAQHWFALLQTGATVGALLLLSFAVFLDARARRVGNLIRLTEQHRELWERMHARPELARILDPTVDLTETPVTAEEEMFVIFIILHLSSTYYGMRAGFFQRLQGLRKDIRLFFSLPIPSAVWEKVGELQDDVFVKFVESCFSERTAQRPQAPFH